MAIQITWEGLAYLYQILFIAAIIFAFREMILEKLNGKRFKRWVEIDTGRSGYVILNKALNAGVIMGQTRTVSFENIKNGMLYFTHDNVENLKLENAPDKWVYYCNTDEFDTVLKTRILQMLLYIFEKNLILIAVVLAGIAAFGAVYGVYLQHDMTTQLNYIAWRVNQTAVVSP